MKISYPVALQRAKIEFGKIRGAREVFSGSTREAFCIHAIVSKPRHICPVFCYETLVENPGVDLKGLPTRLDSRSQLRA